MDEIVYALCAITSCACAVLLLRGYLNSKMRLLLWSTICFMCLTLVNALMYVDIVLVPDADLRQVRDCITFFGLGILIFGMIEETV